MSVSLSAIKGDTFNGVLFNINIDGSPASISSARMQLKKKAKDAEAVKEFILVVGTGTVSLPAQVINIPVGSYVFDVEITLSNGYIKTWIPGTFEIVQDVTE